jgi:dTDP-4-dehydrorhamnose reductase
MDVLDTSNSVTAIEDLLPTVEKLVKKKAHGVYNVVNPGVVSPAEIMRMYAEIVDINHCFRIATVEELKQRGIIRAGRSNVTLSVEKLKAEGIELPEAKDRIREFLHIYKERIAVA